MKNIIALSFLIVSLFVECLNAEDFTTKDRAIDELQMGVSLMTPGGINFTAKGRVANLPLQASIGYLANNVYGVELGYSFLKNSSRTFRSVQVVAGSLKNRNRDWDYAGLSATFQSGGFYIEPGLVVGSGDFSNPQILLQFGYLWQQ